MSSNDSTFFDVIIVGGGPAGLSASLWCRDLGFSTLLLEREREFGGQLLWTHNSINNYLGVQATNGRELSKRFVHQLNPSGRYHRTSVPVSNIDLLHKRVALDDSTIFSCKSIILATGVRRRKLLIPGEEEFQAKGILASGAQIKNETDQKVVLIVGGGDAALENALLLSNKAEKVYIVHRGNAFRARLEFIEAAKSNDKIAFIFRSSLLSIAGEESVRSVEIQDLVSGNKHMIRVDSVLIRIGVIPNTEVVANQLELDEAGYICVNSRFETSVKNVFAVGDVSNPIAPTISSAVGAGASAAKAMRSFLASEMLK